MTVCRNLTALLQVDEDVQRHNELLEVIKGAPAEISDIVSRRRKDFTKEFFVHLHTVTESYFENPTQQNGETGIFFFFFLFCYLMMNNRDQHYILAFCMCQTSGYIDRNQWQLLEIQHFFEIVHFGLNVMEFVYFCTTSFGKAWEYMLGCRTSL